jgi:hypothetical protein
MPVYATYMPALLCWMHVAHSYIGAPVHGVHGAAVLVCKLHAVLPVRQRDIVLLPTCARAVPASTVDAQSAGPPSVAVFAAHS